MDAPLDRQLVQAAPIGQAVGRGHLAVVRQAAVTSPRPASDDHPEVVPLAVDSQRQEPNRPGRRTLTVKHLTAWTDDSRRLPVVLHRIVRGLRRDDHAPGLVRPRKGEELVLERPAHLRVAEVVRHLLGLDHHHRHLAPVGRGQRVDVKAYPAGQLRLASRLEPCAALDLVARRPSLLVVLQANPALGTLVGRAMPDRVKVPAIDALRRFGEADVVPEPRLAVVAGRTDHQPFTLVGHQVVLPELRTLAFDVSGLAFVDGLRRERSRLQS